MKKPILVLSALMLLGTGAFARLPYKKNIDVCQKVLTSFSNKYPNYNVKHWDGTNDNEDVAVFVSDKRKTYAFFDEDGTWVKTETKIAMFHSLPCGIKTTFGNSKYQAWRITDIKQVQSPGDIKYCMKVHYDAGPDGAVPTDGMLTYNLTFDFDGSILKEEPANN